MKYISSYIAALMLSLSGTTNASETVLLKGDWRTVRHAAHVRIYDCGDGSPCGELISVDDEITGGSAFDERNPNHELRRRPLIGLPILGGFSLKKSRWRDGWLYNPETGQTFRSSLELMSKDKLKVKGCLGPFCREQVWIRIK